MYTVDSNARTQTQTRVRKQTNGHRRRTWPGTLDMGIYIVQHEYGTRFFYASIFISFFSAPHSTINLVWLVSLVSRFTIFLSTMGPFCRQTYKFSWVTFMRVSNYAQPNSFSYNLSIIFLFCPFHLVICVLICILFEFGFFWQTTIVLLPENRHCNVQFGPNLFAHSPTTTTTTTTKIHMQHTCLVYIIYQNIIPHSSILTFILFFSSSCISFSPKQI